MKQKNLLNQYRTRMGNEPPFEPPVVAQSGVGTNDIHGNHVTFYGEVTDEACVTLIRNLQVVDDYLQENTFENKIIGHPAIPIWLHIQSPGGNLFPALGVAARMRYLASPVYSIVEGLSSSAATIISMAADRRYITPDSFMLIHEMATEQWGKYSDFVDTMQFLERAMTTLTNFYVRNSSLSAEAVRDILAHDSWFNADEAVQMGFVDEILQYRTIEETDLNFKSRRISNGKTAKPKKKANKN